jgi:hypothetical protein
MVCRTVETPYCRSLISMVCWRNGSAGTGRCLCCQNLCSTFSLYLYLTGSRVDSLARHLWRVSVVCRLMFSKMTFFDLEVILVYWLGVFYLEPVSTGWCRWLPVLYLVACFLTVDYRLGAGVYRYLTTLPGFSYLGVTYKIYFPHTF